MSDNMKVIVKINTHVNEVEVMGPTSRASATITAMVTSEEVLRSETHVSITGPALVCKSLNVRMLTVAREQRSAPINANHGDIGNLSIHLVKNEAFDYQFKDVKVEAERVDIPYEEEATNRPAEAGAAPRRNNDPAPLSSHPIFLKVNLHGKFLHRVTREGLGSSEMCLTKPMDGPFWRFWTQKLTNFETRFWTRDTCHVGSEDTMGKPLSSR